MFLPGKRIEEPGGRHSLGSQRVGHDCVTDTFTFPNNEKGMIELMLLSHFPSHDQHAMVYQDSTEQMGFVVSGVRCCHLKDEVQSLRCILECYDVQRF